MICKVPSNPSHSVILLMEYLGDVSFCSPLLMYMLLTLQVFRDRVHPYRVTRESQHCFQTDGVVRSDEKQRNRSELQGQVRQGSEQPDPVEDVPAHCRGAGLDDL